MDIKRLIAGIAAFGYLTLSSACSDAGNRPPEIKGFVNPGYRDDPAIHRYLDRISIIEGSPLTKNLILVEDKDGDKTKITIESVLKRIERNGSTIEHPVDIKKRQHLFYMPSEGNYSINLNATDGKDTSRKSIEVIVQSPADILSPAERRIFDAINGDMMVHLRNLSSYSSFSFAELVGLLGAESDFRDVVSKKKAKTWAQITEIGRRGLEETYERTRQILDTSLQLKKAEELSIGKDYLNLEGIQLDSLGFTDQGFQEARRRFRPSLTKNELLHVVLPQYLRIRELFPDGRVDKNKLLSDPMYSAKAMAAILEKDYIQLSAMQLISEKRTLDGKEETKFKWVYRPRSHFVKHPQTRAFEKEDVIAAYNSGLPAMIRKKSSVVKKGKYDPMRLAVTETKIHRKRHQDYVKAIEELERKLEDNCYYHKVLRAYFD